MPQPISVEIKFPGKSVLHLKISFLKIYHFYFNFLKMIKQLFFELLLM